MNTGGVTARRMVRACAGTLLAGLLLYGGGAGCAAAEDFRLFPGVDVIGEQKTVQTRYEDTFTDLARAHHLGFEDLVRANPDVDPWLPGAGTRITLPLGFVLPKARRRGLVINIAEYRIYYFFSRQGEPVVSTFPISIGRMDWSTPLGRSSIVSKVTRPAWYPPASVRQEYAVEGRHLARVVPPGPDNPLGKYAMRLSIPGYLIHGTNHPAGVGMRVTHGCIRLYPEDIRQLFNKVAVNTPVQIVDQPYKFGWRDDALYLEVHPPLDGDAKLRNQGMTALTRLYVKATQERKARVDWQRINEVFEAKRGIPVRVGTAAGREAGARNASLF